TTGSLDTKGQLEDSAGAVLASDDDGGDDYNFRLAHGVCAGTYYIKVEGYNASATGRYTIHASGPGPDLIVASASVSDNTLTPAQAFTLNATVRNQGPAAAVATTVDYYQSPDATITADDSPVGTGTVSGLSADHTSAVSIDLTAPSRDGTYYYGACVQSVRDESNTDNNCSPGVQVTVADRTVNIADANLRAAIAAELGKASGAPITKGEMTTLTRLNAANKGIRNLAGLEFATNLTTLWLEYNSISDVSPLAGLTRLRALDLSYNNISDISPLRGLTLLRALDLGGNNISDISPLRRRGLTYLIHLDLEFNNISDISPLRGLTLLSRLNLEFNNISDISPLRGMTRLLELDLEFNNISDVSPLRGLTYLIHLNLEFNNVSDVSPLRELTLDELYIRGNPLSVSSINEHIAALERRGATVRFDPPLRESDFDIELVFLDDAFSERHKRVIQYAARRWMSIIREDLPDYTLTGGWSEECGEQSYRIPSGERIDDLRIYVTSFTDDSNDAVGGWAGPDVLRETSHLSVVGCMGFNLDDNHISLSTALHEIGHVLGVGTSGFKGFLQDPNGDPHFNGPRAIAAFNAAGGRNYTGQKVPVEEGGRGRLAHWRSSVFRGELMDWTGGPMRPLSAITIQALADIGYVVDVSQADPYTLPSAAAKVVAAGSTPDDRLPGRLAPERTCGAGQQREPIYVIDPQGRIVRTLHR
ncbi:MAG: leucine-rich repeat domain-containing protein, partial [Gemmatimonadetes bacterium]|nr:leucine-rich repeat domain-containing protein [Gemmatimonadota bacterium]